MISGCRWTRSRTGSYSKRSSLAATLPGSCGTTGIARPRSRPSPSSPAAPPLARRAMHSLSVGTMNSTMRVLCLGAHADDIEIGCGGLLLRLIHASPKVEIDCIVFSANARRERETRRSAELFLKGAARTGVSVKRFRDGFFSYQGSQIKQEFERLKRTHSPDLVLTHYGGDRHQD